MKTLIIAEAGVNHNGDINIAYKLCEAAKNAGADVVKFQTWKTENLITKDVAQAEYQAENTGHAESQFDMLKRLELSYDEFSKIKEYCEQIGIIFSTTADDFESLDFVASLGVPFLKIGSGEIGNIAFLREHGRKGLPIILSTGMSTLEDIEISIQALREGGAKEITLLHCTTSYPCPTDRVNLLAMQTMKNTFKLPIGYSDHTVGIEVPIAAVSIGATVVEKHFTLDQTMPGPDHKASMEPKEFKEMVEAIRKIEIALGNGKKEPTKEEKEIAKVVTKRIVALKRIEEGTIIKDKHITIKRCEKGAHAKYWDMVVGSVANKSYEIDEGIII